jgi:Protein of unknown function (DUF2949)
MIAKRQAQLLQFLETDLAIPSNSLTLALRQSEPTPDTLPMTLFQYGLISLDQLARIFDWLEAA